MKITLLGCGAARGVPIIGCECFVCSSVESDEDKNFRYRTSAIVDHSGCSVLIDSGPDFRYQSFLGQIKSIDSVIYTHAHYDHISGIDDLRPLISKSNLPLPAYCEVNCFELLQDRFSYFSPKVYNIGLKSPTVHNLGIDFKPVNFNETIYIEGMKIKTFPQYHNPIMSMGLIFNDVLAYSTDVKNITSENLDKLRGIKVWFVECLSYEDSDSHSCFRQTMEWIKYVQPELAVLIHMNHTIDYYQMCADIEKENCLNVKIIPGYDGYRCEI